MNKLIGSLLLLASLSMQPNRAVALDQGDASRPGASITGVVENIDRELARIVVNEHAFEFDDNLVVRDRTGKVLADGLSALRNGLKVRCLESLRKGHPFTTEIWIQDSLDQRSEGTHR